MIDNINIKEPDKSLSMREQVEEYISELKNELAVLDVGQLDDDIRYFQATLDDLLARRHGLTSKYNSLSAEVVKWIGVLDELDEHFSEEVEEVPEVPTDPEGGTDDTPLVPLDPPLDSGEEESESIPWTPIEDPMTKDEDEVVEPLTEDDKL